MKSMQFCGMSVADMDFLQRWSGIKFDIGNVMAFAFTHSIAEAAADYHAALRVNYLWRSVNGKFPITDAAKVFPPKLPVDA